MKINKKSWHYRLLVDNGTVPSTNLCTYFWQVCGWIAIAAMMVIFAIAVLAVALVMIAAPILLLWLPEMVNSIESDDPNIYANIVILGFVLWCITAAIALIHGGAWFFRELRWRSSEKKDESLLRQYLSAKKARICPLIEFEEES